MYTGHAPEMGPGRLDEIELHHVRRTDGAANLVRHEDLAAGCVTRDSGCHCDIATEVVAAPSYH